MTSATAEASPPTGLVLSDDLIFSSRIVATGRALGLTLRAVATAAQLETLARQHTPRCVILDLANPSLKVAELVPGLQQGEGRSIRIVAYGSHVDTAMLRGAREAGCDVVLPRSKFVEDLPRELPNWMHSVESEPRQP